MMIAATSSLFAPDPTHDLAYLLSPFPYVALAALPPNTYSSFSLPRVPYRGRLCLLPCSC